MVNTRLPHTGHLHLAAHNAAPEPVRSWIQRGPLPDRAQIPKSVCFVCRYQGLRRQSPILFACVVGYAQVRSLLNARNRLTSGVPLGGGLYLNCSTKLALLPAMNGEVSALEQ